MGLLARIGSTPQYALHPQRALRRVLHGPKRIEGQRTVTRLPWGLPLEVYLSDSIGYSIVVGRVFDPGVTETLHRLIDPGDLVADVGANVGYLTSLAATRAGAEGRVLAFEPHPRIFELLTLNVSRWRGADGIAPVELRQVALSDEAGEGALVAGPGFEEHMGMASLESPAGDGGDAITVSLARLDELVDGDDRIGVLKIDVEGHEPDVLRGAERLLGSGAIRDIVFEDHDPYPSEATQLVEDAGYELISIDNDLLGLKLREPRDRGEIAAWPGPSYLATLEPERARSRLSARGWEVKGIGPWFSRRAQRADRTAR